MKLRGKLLAAQAPLIAALAVVAAGAVYTAVRFGAAPGEILHENFRSFDAARGMLNAADTIDRLLLSARLRAEPPSAGGLAEAIAAFEREVRLQESNVTEKGEREATQELRRAWEAYRDALAAAATLGGHAGPQRLSSTLRGAVDRILELNRDAMRQKSARARAEARHVGAVLFATAVVAFLLAVAVSGAALRRILAPVRVLERAVERLAHGDFDAEIRIDGNDEIAALSASFNEMAVHLARYRASSLGDLLEANSRLESVMDSLADAVVVYDLDGAPLAHNEVARRVLGTGGIDLDRLPESLADAAREAFASVRQSGEPYEPSSIEAAVEVAGTPAPHWILVSATPVRTRGGVLTGVTIAFRDVTRARRVEDFTGDLVAAAAHELRTPLTSLHMAVHLCLEQAAGPLTDRQQDLLGAARADCERLETVVEELLEMARLESGAARLQRAQVNVGELVRDAAARHETLARQQGAVLAVVPGDALLTVDADAARLAHALDNLIENALLHAGDGRRVDVGFQSDGGAVRLFVDDAGPGVPADVREQVFAKFFRVPGTRKQGSGLGLSIVQDIVSAHGGEAGVENSPLGGARFWFTIPAAPPRRASDGSNGSNGHGAPAAPSSAAPPLS